MGLPIWVQTWYFIGAQALRDILVGVDDAFITLEESSKTRMKFIPIVYLNDLTIIEMKTIFRIVAIKPYSYDMAIFGTKYNLI